MAYSCLYCTSTTWFAFLEEPLCILDLRWRSRSGGGEQSRYLWSGLQEHREFCVLVAVRAAVTRWRLSALSHSLTRRVLVGCPEALPRRRSRFPRFPENLFSVPHFSLGFIPSGGGQAGGSAPGLTPARLACRPAAPLGQCMPARPALFVRTAVFSREKGPLEQKSAQLLTEERYLPCAQKCFRQDVCISES